MLRAGDRDYVVSAEALTYMRQRALAGPVIASLAEHSERHFDAEVAWIQHLEQLGITAPRVAPDPVRIGTEGAVWGSIRAHGLLPDTVILSDDAAQQFLRALIWWFYADLKAYRRAPGRRQRTALRARFDRIFRRRTGFVTLDRLLQRLHANKNELLAVLDRSEIPLHTNGSERDLRPQVIKRKISGGARRLATIAATPSLACC